MTTSPPHAQTGLPDDRWHWIRLAADERALEAARAFVLEQVQAEHLPARTTFRIELALEEILVNVTSYAYPPDAPGEVEVGCCTNSGQVCLVIRDAGRPFNPLERTTPDTRQDIEQREVGGLGIFLTREMVDQISYERQNNRNVTSLSITCDASPSNEVSSD